MALPVAALVTGGAALAGSGINALSTSAMNKKTRQWNEKMYGIQKQDQIDFWNMENQYNSPGEQMKRLEAAGLNPNLVYGNGATASGGDLGKPAPVAAWHPDAPQVDTGALTDSLFKYQDVRIKDAQISNMEKQGTLLDIQAAQAALNLDTSDFDLALKKDLRDTSLQAAKAGLDKTLQETNLTFNRADNEFKKGLLMDADQLQRAATLKLSGAQLEKTMQEIKNLKQDGRLKSFEEQLNRSGNTKSDPIYLRMMQSFLQKNYPSVLKLIQ